MSISVLDAVFTAIWARNLLLTTTHVSNILPKARGKALTFVSKSAKYAELSLVCVGTGPSHNKTRLYPCVANRAYQIGNEDLNFASHIFCFFFLEKKKELHIAPSGKESESEMEGFFF